MERYETSTMEYKERITKDLLKEVVAFANTNGGIIYIGVDDRGNIVGLEDADEEQLKLTNMLQDSIRPDITLFTSTEILSENKCSYIKLEVSVGSNRPYYLSSKGMRPEGVYIRQGTSSAPASMERIREIIRDTDGIKYEQLRSLNQDLTFIYASEIFKSAGVDFGQSQYTTLGITTTNGLFTNLGLLLSDQCPHLIKAASFRGTTREYFKYRDELTGSVLKQAQDAYRFVMTGLPTLTTFVGTERFDNYAVNPIAIRESIHNALVHREYSIDGPTTLSVFDDRIEVVSLGGLPIGHGHDKILPGVSLCRNKALADVFYRLKWIEAYGTGIPRIEGSYIGSSVQPELDISDNSFRIVLPYKKEVLDGIVMQDKYVEQHRQSPTAYFGSES